MTSSIIKFDCTNERCLITPWRIAIWPVAKLIPSLRYFLLVFTDVFMLPWIQVIDRCHVCGFVTYRSVAMDMEGNRNQNMPSTTLCRTGCGFYGNQAFDGMCSKCYKDALKRKQNAPVSGRSTPTTGTYPHSTTYHPPSITYPHSTTFPPSTTYPSSTAANYTVNSA